MVLLFYTSFTFSLDSQMFNDTNMIMNENSNVHFHPEFPFYCQNCQIAIFRTSDWFSLLPPLLGRRQGMFIHVTSVLPYQELLTLYKARSYFGLSRYSLPISHSVTHDQRCIMENFALPHLHVISSYRDRIANKTATVKVICTIVQIFASKYIGQC